MEKTMFTRFTMGQTLRALFQEQNLPPALHPYITSYEKTFDADIRGTFINDDLAFDINFSKDEETPTWKDSQLSNLEPEPYKLLKRWIQDHDPHYISGGTIARTAYVRKKIGRLGQNFQPKSASVGDSCVIFNRPDRHWSAGSIDSIFSHTRHTTPGHRKTQTFLLIKEYTALTPEHAVLDHYSDFPEAGGRLFYKRFESAPLLLPIDDIHCHAAFAEEVLSQINEKLVMVLPLNKVNSSDMPN